MPKPRIGDTVEIIGNIPCWLEDRDDPIMGTVTNVDGGYILVLLDDGPEGEFYPCELKVI